MEPLLGRIETLEQHVQALTQQTASIARRLRWWRRLACSVMVLTVFSLPLSLGAGHDDKHGDKNDKELRQRIRALERKLQHVTSERDENGLPALVITGANLRIVNGTGNTESANGLGNLIVGYNEPRGTDFPGESPDSRTGSHNVVVGTLHNFSSFGGLVVGVLNEISADFASVNAGVGNTASGFASSVSGGVRSDASGGGASVSGGLFNTASGSQSSVSGGTENTASTVGAWVSRGFRNTAGGVASSVSGGVGNTATATADFSSVSGGRNRTVQGEADWRAGGLFQDQ